MEVTVLPPPLCPRTRPAAAPVPLARTLRIRLNHACVSSRPDAAAAAKKPIWPGRCSHGKGPTAIRHSESAADEKENKNAPAAVAKIGNLSPRPCSRGDDEVPRSPLDGGDTKPRVGAGAAIGHAAAPPPAAKRKATTTADYSGQARRASPSRVPFATTRKQQVGGGDGAAASGASPSPRSSDGEGTTVRALLARARPASDAIRMRDIKRLRAQARWELDQVVQTVEFNDAFITPQDVLR